jgi:hypothetical protein
MYDILIRNSEDKILFERHRHRQQYNIKMDLRVSRVSGLWMLRE